MKAFILVLALVCLALPAFGKPHVIWVLGTEPLFGFSQSHNQFFAQMRKYPTREKIALKALGIDQAQFERGMRSAPSVVPSQPFHLDAMTYYNGGVKVARDVIVPAHTWMWVVHLPGKTIYVPQACGNISTVAAGVESYATSAPARHRVAQAAPLMGVHPDVEKPASPAPSPVALAASPPSIATPVASSHHGGFPWWILLVPVALMHGGGGGSGSTPAPLVVIPSVHPSSSPSSSPSISPAPSPSMSPVPSPSISPVPSPSISPVPSPSISPVPSPSPSKTPCHCPTPTPKPTATPTPCPTPTPKPTPTPCPTGTKAHR